jgi:hypothetical protein
MVRKMPRLFKRFMSNVSTYQEHGSGKTPKGNPISFPGESLSMNVLWIVVLLCAGAVLAMSIAFPGHVQAPDRYCATAIMDNPLDTSMEHGMSGLLPEPDRAGHPEHTALFSKYVSADTPYIIVSLYSGDPADPLSLTVITPDKTLGPFTDGSDGRIDGRIELKINNPGDMTPGLWKFQVHSNKNISSGSLENLSWIKTGNP